MSLGVFLSPFLLKVSVKSSEVGEAAAKKGFRLLQVLSLTRSSGLPALRTYLLHLMSPSVTLKSLLPL